MCLSLALSKQLKEKIMSSLFLCVFVCGMAVMFYTNNKKKVDKKAEKVKDLFS